jgi:hypothetical protein
MKLSAPARLVLVVIWIAGALGILWRAVETQINLLAIPDLFGTSGGSEQISFIFVITAIYGLTEAALLAMRVSRGFWVRKGLTTVVIFGSFTCLLSFAPAYEPAYSSAAIATLLVASVWTAMLPRHIITPNNTPHSDARGAAVPHQTTPGARAGGRGR